MGDKPVIFEVVDLTANASQGFISGLVAQLTEGFDKALRRFGLTSDLARKITMIIREGCPHCGVTGFVIEFEEKGDSISLKMRFCNCVRFEFVA